MFPEIPVTTVKAIEEAGEQIKAAVFAMLCSQFSPPRVAHAIFAQYGLLLSSADVMEFRKQIPEQYFLEPSKLAEAQKYIDVDVDAIQLLSRMLHTSFSRLEAMLTMVDVDARGAPSHVMISREMKNFFDLMERYVHLRQELGELPTQPVRLLVSNESDLPRVRDLIGEAEDASNQ